MNTTTTTTTTTSSTSTTPSNAPSLLHQLLSRPITSSAPPPTFDELLTRPGPSSAPPPTFNELHLLTSSAPPSTSPAPPPPTIEDEPPVIHLSDDEWEMVPVSTAHPNYWDPELHQLVVEELLGTTHYRLPENSALSLPEQEQPQSPLPSPRSSLGSPLPPLLSSLGSPLQPLPPSPLSPSPASSPPPQLPARRKQFNRLRVNTPYKVKEWKRTGGKLEVTIYNNELTALYIITLPKNIQRPNKQLRLHHLFDDLYMTITRLNGKLNFTFHP